MTEWLFPNSNAFSVMLIGIIDKKNVFRYFFTELKKIDQLSYSFYKHDAIDIANPSSMQDACPV